MAARRLGLAGALSSRRTSRPRQHKNLTARYFISDSKRHSTMLEAYELKLFLRKKIQQKHNVFNLGSAMNLTMLFQKFVWITVQYITFITNQHTQSIDTVCIFWKTKSLLSIVVLYLFANRLLIFVLYSKSDMIIVGTRLFIELVKLNLTLVK